jgi:HK97 family phage portal protein
VGFLRKLADVFDPTPAALPAVASNSVEVRSVSSRDPEIARLFGFDYGGHLINANVAPNLSTVLACTNAISSAVASLPAFVYRLLDTGREEDPQHPVSRLITGGPNMHQSWADWIEWTLASVLLRGNAISEIISDNRGAVVELRPVPMEWCSITLLPNGRLAYDISEINSIYGGQGGQRRVLQSEIFHLRDRSDDAVLGRSRLQRAAAVIASGLTLQSFGAALYENSLRPSGAVELDGRLTNEGFLRLQNDLRTLYSGTGNTGKAIILENGLKWKPISISPEDSEFLASRKFTTEELCRIFNVPPVIIGDLQFSSFNNSETLTRMYATHTLTPWITKIEQEFSRSVFSRSDRILSIDMAGLMRGAFNERWAGWKIALETKALDLNEVREAEGYNPRAASWRPEGTATAQ